MGGNSKPDTVTVTASATASEAATSHRRSPFISAPPPSAASAAHSPPAMADPFAPKTMKRKNKKGLALSAPPPKPASADSDGQGPGGLGNAKEETLEIGVEFGQEFLFGGLAEAQGGEQDEGVHGALIPNDLVRA